MRWMYRTSMVVVSGALLACAADDKDGMESTPTIADASASDTSSSGAEASSSGGEAMSCNDARLDAVAFLGANRACEVDEDCTQVSTFCLDGSTCGSSPIAVGYDEGMWTQISAGLDTCMNCGADPCGACSACTQGICTLSVDCE